MPTKFVIKSNEFAEVIIKPMLADLMPDGQFDGTLHEFTHIDPVRGSRTLASITGLQNILQRRDASCKLNYTQVAKSSGRRITVDELYGATENCQNEFYQGCLKDYRDQNPRFHQLILKFFRDALKADITSNAYFGDVTAAPNSTWSINKFDGVFTWIQKYISDGTIPSTQSFAVDSTYTDTDGNITPTGAYTLLKNLYDSQSTLLYSLLDTAKGFYVTKEVATQYWEYLVTIGAANTATIDQYMNGMPALRFKGIPIYYEPVWSPILRSMNSNNPTHAAILTLRGNFVIGTDSTYGEGPNLNQALRIRYDEDELVWRWAMFFRLGTAIAMPEHLAIGMTEIA